MDTIEITASLLLFAGVLMLGKAAHIDKRISEGLRRLYKYKTSATVLVTLAFPAMARAQVDLRSATESGNAIIMYLSGTFAAVGIVAAGVAMMMGRQSIAKWAFAGAMVCGLAFAIVRTMWSNMGIEAAGVGTFDP